MPAAAHKLTQHESQVLFTNWVDAVNIHESNQKGGSFMLATPSSLSLLDWVGRSVSPLTCSQSCSIIAVLVTGFIGTQQTTLLHDRTSTRQRMVVFIFEIQLALSKCSVQSPIHVAVPRPAYMSTHMSHAAPGAAARVYACLVHAGHPARPLPVRPPRIHPIVNGEM